MNQGDGKERGVAKMENSSIFSNAKKEVVQKLDHLR